MDGANGTELPDNRWNDNRAAGFRRLLIYWIVISLILIGRTYAVIRVVPENSVIIDIKVAVNGREGFYLSEEAAAEIKDIVDDYKAQGIRNYPKGSDSSIGPAYEIALIINYYTGLGFKRQRAVFLNQAEKENYVKDPRVGCGYARIREGNQLYEEIKAKLTQWGFN